MKKFLFIASAFMLLLTGCSKTAEYSKNMEVRNLNTSISAAQPLQKTYVYMDKSSLGTESIKSSTALGKDELKIDVGNFVKEETTTFFKYYLTNLEFTTDKNVLNSGALIVMPEIFNFGYGFYSYDGFDVDARPYVAYTLNLKIFKNGKQIYSNVISKSERRTGELMFFGMGNTSYAQIGPVFQKALAEDYNSNSVEILDAINSN
ncbi:MAG: hypothetical protein GX282_00270 [Campylobacteraceae bacterium]|nr:hypothetical protein [Campylobacteraceae bacterium]